MSIPRLGYLDTALGIIYLLPQIHSPSFSNLLCVLCGLHWADPGFLASGWIQTRVALTGDQKVGEASGWGICSLILLS